MAWVAGIGNSRSADSSVLTGTLAFKLFVKIIFFCGVATFSGRTWPGTSVFTPLSGRWRQQFPAKHCKSLSDYMALHSRRHFLLFIAIRTSKVKVKSLCTPWRYMGGMEVQVHSFLTSELSGGECYLCAAAVLHSRGGGLGTHWLGAGWVPEFILDSSITASLWKFQIFLILLLPTKL